MSNRGPSAYQPNALPLSQTGSQQVYLTIKLLCTSLQTELANINFRSKNCRMRFAKHFQETRISCLVGNIFWYQTIRSELGVVVVFSSFFLVFSSSSFFFFSFLFLFFFINNTLRSNDDINYPPPRPPYTHTHTQTVYVYREGIAWRRKVC